jgi:hypothetical protein
MTAGRVTVSFWIFESNIALEYRLKGEERWQMDIVKRCGNPGKISLPQKRRSAA